MHFFIWGLLPYSIGHSLSVQIRDFCPFWRIFYIFMITDLEPKIFVSKSPPQKQSWKAHKVGKFCQKDQTSTCLRSKVTNRAIIAFNLAPKWQRAANGGFCKFGSFQLYLTHRQLDWSTKKFIESHFLGYPTCLLFAHVVWWSTALWTARSTRRKRPGRSLTVGITSVEIFFN